MAGATQGDIRAELMEYFRRRLPLEEDGLAAIEKYVNGIDLQAIRSGKDYQTAFKSADDIIEAMFASRSDSSLGSALRVDEAFKKLCPLFPFCR